MDNLEWFKIKKYPNIAKPITFKDTKRIVQYITNPSCIATHKFDPLIHRTLKQRKYRPSANAPKNEDGKRIRTVQEPKIRHIYYPSHFDSLIYSYYASILDKAYEAYLIDKPFQQVPVAYRKIAAKGKGYNKSNIEFAYDAFSFILHYEHAQMSVLVADISSFFDNLDHRILHTQWKKVLGVHSLPDDHYAVYKNLTHFSYVDEVQLFQRFGDKLIVERHEPNDASTTVYKRKRVKKIWNLKRERVVAYCTKKEFYAEARDLIRTHTPQNPSHTEKRKGIPQGTPISAVLANIYMIDFDAQVFKETSCRGAFYQRYSDDIIIVCDRKDEAFFKDLLHREIENSSKLEIQEKKTHIYRYDRDDEHTLTGGMYSHQEALVNANIQLEYLGFQFDGSKVRVKPSALSKFYRSMKRSFRRGVYFAKAPHIHSDDLYERKLYDRYTHYGAKRRLKYIADPHSKSGYRRSKYHVWGNLFSYMQKANRIMKPINQDDSILRQTRKIWDNFHQLKKESYREIRESEKRQE